MQSPDTARAAAHARAAASAAHPFQSRGSDPQPTSNNAARLAAEAWFSTRPVAPVAANPVSVVVLRKRAVTPDVAAATPTTALPAPPDDQPLRAPKVFTLRAAPPAVGIGQPLGAANPGVTAVRGHARRASRIERIGHDTRAGVMRHVKPLAAHAAQPAMATEPEASVEASGSLTLLQQLARLDLVFETIRQAQTFTLRDPAFEAEWLGLSQAADVLALALAQARVRAARTSASLVAQ